MTDYLALGKAKRKRRVRVRVRRHPEGWWHCEREWLNGTYASAESWSLWWAFRRAVLTRRRRAAIVKAEGCGWTGIYDRG